MSYLTRDPYRQAPIYDPSGLLSDMLAFEERLRVIMAEDINWKSMIQDEMLLTLKYGACKGHHFTFDTMTEWRKLSEDIQQVSREGTLAKRREEVEQIIGKMMNFFQLYLKAAEGSRCD